MGYHIYIGTLILCILIIFSKGLYCIWESSNNDNDECIVLGDWALISSFFYPCLYSVPSLSILFSNQWVFIGRWAFIRTRYIN